MSAGSITELVRVLVAAGATPDIILAAVTSAEAAKDAAIEASRSKARARVQRWRDNHQEETSRNVTQRSVADTSRLTRVEDSSSKKDISGKEEKKDRAPAALTPRAELEKVLDSEHAQAVIEHRRVLRKPLSPRAAKLLADKFAVFPDANAAADKMIAAGWLKIEPHWGQDRPNSTAPPGKRMNAVEANLARRIRKNEPEGGRRDNGDAELLPPDRPRLPDFIGDVGKSLTWDG